MAFDPNKHMTKVSGKDYLPVAARLTWFRDQCPNGTIHTDHIEITNERAVFKAAITRIGDGGEMIGASTGYGSETPKDFGDYIEKAETKAIGRALAALGYGTQFAPEFDEGDRIVDTPQPPRSAPQNGAQHDPGAPPSRTNDLLATERQRNLIDALARELKISGKDLDARCMERCGVPVAELSRTDASTLIESLKEAQAKRQGQPA